MGSKFNVTCTLTYKQNKKHTCVGNTSRHDMGGRGRSDMYYFCCCGPYVIAAVRKAHKGYHLYHTFLNESAL